MKHKDNILKLAAEGKSYREIRRLLRCSSSTISYHLGKGQKEKTDKRSAAHNCTLNGILKQRLDNFCVVNRRNKKRYRRVKRTFSVKELKAFLLKNPVCYLTGEAVDLTDRSSWQCDHVIPVSKGGKATLANLGLATREANIAKSGATLSEFLLLCSKVLKHHGYTVSLNQ